MDVLGVTVSAPQDLPEHGVRVAFVELANTKLELLEPLGQGSPIAKFLERNAAGGVHHICLEVDDIGASVAHVGARVRLLDAKPKIGAHGLPVVFAHPKDLCGVLTELEEVQPASQRTQQQQQRQQGTAQQGHQGTAAEG
ncbi:methylmalonyl-epimerase [Micractinium conductrix]|uniref:Methylmalonyl-epimerase n=1 Tax=Micractinium conductrix TaxID=554055 RepID=A0A2P6VHA1_9CHLO|nr:methylmalonyl-epimerase [Micractinium conductrix]|eukprot:PSC73460.1 methylmalonyl-epimerase [Micractinium conductrix]